MVDKAIPNHLFIQSHGINVDISDWKRGLYSTFAAALTEFGEAEYKRGYDAAGKDALAALDRALAKGTEKL